MGYEDNVFGVITNDRFVQMSQKYNDEQSELEATLVDKHKHLQELESKASNYKAFMSTIKKYTRVKKLTRGILHDLVSKIVVHHAKKEDGYLKQRLKIYYNYVGQVHPDQLERLQSAPVKLKVRKGVEWTPEV